MEKKHKARKGRMTRDEVLEKLCVHDPRNPLRLDDDEVSEVPDGITNDDPRPIECFCDNCFYGRHRMAETILELMEDAVATQIK